MLQLSVYSLKGSHGHIFNLRGTTNEPQLRLKLSLTYSSSSSTISYQVASGLLQPDAALAVDNRYLQMNSNSATHDQHQKDFLNAFFQSETTTDLGQRAREPDTMFHNDNIPLPPMMSLPQQANMDMLENLMAMQERVGQAAASAQGQSTTPQMLLEQQMRLNQLQQLQQLQNQIFQQQVSDIPNNLRGVCGEYQHK